MRKHITSQACRIPVSLRMCLLMLMFAITQSSAQQAIVLPSNGVNTQETCLQGGFRYHRQLYLITPSELDQTNLQNGMLIDAIGFTIGAAPDTSARGLLKLYLQNTTDTESRFDTDWTTVPVATNSHSLDPLIQGDYEWQVQTVCSGNSPFSTSAFFSNADLSGCNQPEDLTTTNVTTTTATFNWQSVESASFTHYFVEYSRIDSSNWQSATTTNSFYNAAGLLPGKLYQWKVQAVCSNGSSASSGLFFQTNTADVCNEPSGLTVGVVTNTSVALSWTAAAGATRYDIQYRRKNTESWFSSISFTNSITIGSLTQGTNYEWRVRTVCAGGTGSYVNGTDFLTTGTTTCYAPEGLKETNLTDTSVTLQWTMASNASSYILRYRLRNAISWANAFTPMTLVHNDTITIPETTGGWSFPFSGTGTSTFTYTGGGVYVAWEYSNSTLPLASLTTSLATIAGTSFTDAIGSDSSDIVLCLKAIGDTSQVSPLTSDPLRPETRFGSPGLRDSAEVVVVYSTGYQAVPYGNPIANAAVIRNLSPIAHTYPVTLTVKNQAGTVRFTETLMVTVDDDSSALVTFSDWSPSIIETDSVIVSIPVQPSENVTLNNKAYYLQKVNSSSLSYSDDGSPVTTAGFGEEDGLILARHHVDGCARISGTSIFLTNNAEGQEVYGVILDEDGAILSTSPSFIPTEDELGVWHTFYFSDPPVVTDEDIYVGLAQTSGAIAYNPVGVQWESTFIRENSYFRADLDGTNLTDHPSPGRLMIRAQLTQGLAAPVIEGDLSLCADDMNTLSVASLDLRYATSVIGASSEYSAVQYSADQALGVPDVFPGSGGNPSAWASSTFDGQREYLSLGFVDAAPINRIVIYETFNPGAVDSAFVRNPNTGNLVLVYSHTADEEAYASNALTINFPMTAFDVSEIRIAINSPEVSGFNSIDAVAIGQYDDSPSYSSILWAPNGETTTSIQVSNAGTYTVTVQDGTCSASASAVVFTPTGTTPVITAGSAVSFCQGGSVMLTSDQPTGNLWNTGATTQSITVSTGGSYSLTHDDGTGCGLTNSNTIIVTVYTLPVATITGNLSICPGASTTLNAGVYTSYLWSNGATTQMISVSTIGVYNVTVTDANGCTDVASAVVVNAPELDPVITGDETICLGSSTLLNAGSYSNYDWSTGATTQTISVSTPGVYSVTVEDVNGCTGSSNITIFGLVPPSPIITGIGGFCPGGQTTLNAGAGYVSYAWSNGSTLQMITVNSAATYTVTVTDGNGCTGTDNQVVVVFTPPAVAIAGTLSFCAGSSTQLDAGPGYSVYLWSTGDNTQTIVVDTTETYSVTVTDGNGCTGTDSATTTNEGAIPESPEPIEGPTSGVCGSTNVEYSIDPVENAAFYVWTVPANVTIVSGQGTTTLVVDFESGFTSGTIVVAASNACGQSPSIDPTFIIVTGTPGNPVSITGPSSNVCPGDIVNYSTATVAFATSYHWTVPANAQITAGQNSTSITVQINNGFTGGNVCVSAVNACGSSAPFCKTIANGDMDNDGVPDCLDNCPTVANPNQRDKDHDGVGDVCDPCNNNQQGGPCDDGDPCTVNDHKDPYCVCVGTYMDSDNDGVCNAFDICPGFDDNIDTDNDGVPNGCDACPGFDDNIDTDNDGIPDGCDNCSALMVDAGDCESVYYGYPPAQCKVLQANALSGTGPFTYHWSNGSTSQTPNVCPVNTTTYTVTVTDALGCTGTDAVTVEVYDVRCGGGNKNVEVCHYNASNNTYTTLCIKANLVPGHLSHGDALGECGINPCSGSSMMVAHEDHHDADEHNDIDLAAIPMSEDEITYSLVVNPNPVKNEFTISGTIHELTLIQYRLVDMQGREILAGRFMPESIHLSYHVDASKVVTGFYMLQVVQGENYHQTKLVIAR